MLGGIKTLPSYALLSLSDYVIVKIMWSFEHFPMGLVANNLTIILSIIITPMGEWIYGYDMDKKNLLLSIISHSHVL